MNTNILLLIISLSLSPDKKQADVKYYTPLTNNGTIYVDLKCGANNWNHGVLNTPLKTGTNQISMNLAVFSECVGSNSSGQVKLRAIIY